MNKIALYGFIVISVFLTGQSALAWKLPIEVATHTGNGEKVYNKLVIGMESGATDGFDNLWDTPALITSPDPESKPMLRAYFTPTLSLPHQGGGDYFPFLIPSPLTGEGQGGGETLLLWKDIRGSTKGNTTWDISIDSVPAGKAVVLSWNTPQGLLKPGERLVLRDNDNLGSDGQPIQTDIMQASNYAFLPDGVEPRSLSLVFSKESRDSSRSGGGSAFGCGTVRLHNGGAQNGPPAGGTSALGVIILFLPLLFIRIMRQYLAMDKPKGLSLRYERSHYYDMSEAITRNGRVMGARNDV